MFLVPGTEELFLRGIPFACVATSVIVFLIWFFS